MLSTADTNIRNVLSILDSKRVIWITSSYNPRIIKSIKSAPKFNKSPKYDSIDSISTNFQLDKSAIMTPTSHKSSIKTFLFTFKSVPAV